MSTFAHTSDVDPSTIQITITPPDLSRSQLLSHRPFITWLSRLQRNLRSQSSPSHPFHSSPYSLRSVTVQAVDFFGSDHVGFLKLHAEVANDGGEKLPGAVFLRGGSVGMLVILQPTDADPQTEADKHAILTVQPRVAACSLSFAEIPAGMLDDSGTFAGAAAKEIEEECGLKIAASELTDMTQLALARGSGGGEQEEEEELVQGTYPSPGGTDEYIPLFLHQRRVERSMLREWQGKLTGLREEGERITLRLVRLEDLWREGARDGKTLAAWALYEGLRRDGLL